MKALKPIIISVALALSLSVAGCQSMTGQTAGKALAGLRVLRPDGSRPATGAIAARTLLRLVDWLPFLYLVGFICLLATGQRRQRVGDLAAGTAVVRPVPLARGQAGRTAFVLPLAILAIVGLSIQFGSHPGPGTYQAHGVSFRYPAAWRQGATGQMKASRNQQNLLWGVAVGPGDPVDTVTMQSFRLNIPVTAANLNAVTPTVQSVTQGLFRQAGGSLQAGAEQITMGGLPAIRFQGTLTLAGQATQSTVIYAFDGLTEYFVNCQTVPAQAEAMRRGCAQVVRTFRAG